MDEFFPLQFGAVTELQGVENSADDSEERQTYVAKHVSTNGEDEQLREAFKRVESLCDFQMICHYILLQNVSDKSFENHKVIRRVFFLCVYMVRHKHYIYTVL